MGGVAVGSEYLTRNVVKAEADRLEREFGVEAY